MTTDGFVINHLKVYVPYPPIFYAAKKKEKKKHVSNQLAWIFENFHKSNSHNHGLKAIIHIALVR